MSFHAHRREGASLAPVIHQVRSVELELSTTPTGFASLRLPARGTYRLEFVQRLRQLTAASVGVNSFDAVGSHVVEMAGSWSRAKRDRALDVGRSFLPSSLVTTAGSLVGDDHEVTWTGHVVVSSATTVTLRCTLGTGTGLMLRGSTVRVFYESSNTTSYGHANHITITSGVGYAGSVLTSTSAAQWTADGVNISGETGATYVVTREREGQAIRCGDSNAIQMWTPSHLPTAFKTNGVDYGGWYDPAYAATVTLNTTNVASLANLFSGGPPLANSTGGQQPAYDAGGGFINFVGSAAPFGLISAVSPLLLSQYVMICARYDSGVETSFAANQVLWGDVNANTRRLLTRTGGVAIYNDTGSSIVSAVEVNGGARVTAPLPLPMSLIEFAFTRTPGRYGVFAPSNNIWTGRVREILALARDPSPGVKSLLQGYMTWHNGVGANLPPDHPYAAAPPRVS